MHGFIKYKVNQIAWLGLACSCGVKIYEIYEISDHFALLYHQSDRFKTLEYA